MPDVRPLHPTAPTLEVIHASDDTSRAELIALPVGRATPHRRLLHQVMASHQRVDVAPPTPPHAA